MVEKSSPLTGGCHCGGVRFHATTPPEWVGICHCASCRRATGGALVAACGFLRETVRIVGDTLRRYPSSPGVLRGFCAVCGTSLTYESERWPGDIHVMIGAFDDPSLVAPTFHIFAGEALPWLGLSDRLPRYRTTPSAGDLLPGPGG